MIYQAVALLALPFLPVIVLVAVVWALLDRSSEPTRAPGCLRCRRRP